MLLIGALGISVLLAEIGARIALSMLNAMPPKRPATDKEAHLVEMLQRAPHPDIVYELQPDLECRFQGVTVRTNSLGWRGPERPTAKAEGGFRVLGLGDSVMFGWGVEWPQSGIARLERLLQGALPEHAVDVIGTGVPGYNTAMEAALLKLRGLQLQPDVVIVDFVGNDMELPNFLLAPADFWRVDHCFLIDLAYRAWRSSWLDARTPFVWAPGDGNGHFESDPERSPPEYRHLVGPSAFRRALRSILDLGQEHGFRVLMSCHYSLSPQAKVICRDLDIPVVEVGDRITTWLRHEGNPTYVTSALTVPGDDPHPSAIVHDWWAEAVFTKLEELDWLPK